MKPNRKVKKPQASYSKLELEEIIGLTVTNRNALASSSVFSNDSKLVYTAGCVVVIYDVDLGTQSHLMVSNRSPKPLGCVAVSKDGSYIAAGESGHQPTIIVWSSATLAPISELKGHRYGLACTAFSPDGKHLVSVGTPQDCNLCLWDWRSGSLVKKLKTCSPFSDVSSVSFSADASSILTAGKRHIKIWAVGLSTKSRARTQAVSLSMHGKHINLGQYKGCVFVDITSPFKINGSVVDEMCGDSVLGYALTSSGFLCVLHGGLTITHSVNLKVERAYALSTSQEFISCACSNGIVKLYTVHSLEYAGELPYSEDKQNNNTTNTQLATFPDAIACHFSTSQKLVVVYRDCSLYIWNIHGKLQATKCCVLVSHGGCIWDIKNLSCENMHNSSLACVARGCTGGVSFATCSADGTIKLWDMTLQSVSIESRPTLSTGQHHVITESLGTLCIASAGTFEHESVVSGVISKGYRAMAASSDGKYLAAGDSDGNLHIFDLFTSDYKSIKDCHKGEVLSLSFSLPVNKSINSAELETDYFLASGGHDKTIHLFDVKRNFDLVASIDDHLAAVSSLKLTGNGCRIITCGSDKSLIFCDVAGRNDDYNISVSNQQKTFHGTINDIALDPNTQIAVTVGQDKKINMFDTASGRVIRSFKQGGDFGDPIKVALDASCSYVACSYSDKSICVYDFVSGEMVARAMGHGEGINGIIFLPDCKHLVSVGSDGCIFVWKVPAVFTSRMLQRIKGNSCPLSLNTIAQCTAMNRNECCEENHVRPRFMDTPMLCEAKGLKETPTFRFSISRLPQWAKSKVSSPFVIPLDPISSEVVGLEEHSPSKSIDEGIDPDDLAFHTPSNYNDLRNNKGSTTLGCCRSFALDKRWLTIHTVCLDLSNSPEVFNMKKQMLPFTSNSPQCPALEATDNESVKLPEINISLNHTSSNSKCKFGQAGCINVHIGLNDSGCLSHQSQLSNACVSGEEYGHENSEQLQLSASNNQVVNNCILNSVSNSAISKIEYPSLTKQRDSERGSSYQQGMMGSNSLQNLLNKNHIAFQRNYCSSSSVSYKVKTPKINDQQECEIMRDEKQTTFDACKEALRNLDTSSKAALVAFSNLRDIQSTYKNSEGPDSLFYSEAAELFPSIAKNVQQIAKFVSYCGYDTQCL